MINRAQKVCFFIILFVLLIIFMKPNTYASRTTGLWNSISINTDTESATGTGDNTSTGGSGTTFNPNDWKPDSSNDTTGTDKVKDIGNNIIGPIRVLGSIISVVALIIMGIKYILGSAEERAEYKKTMLPYLLGALMVFAITNILGFIIDIVGGF